MRLLLGAGLAVVLGVSLVLARRPRQIGGGALAAFGITTLLAFGAYVMSSVLNETFGEPFGPAPGPGSWLGLASGAVLLAGGLLAIASAPKRTG